jgi:KDO2-lipid IV(A) lauroyltransferase
MDALAYDGSFWRRLAQLGASRAPAWWVRCSAPVFGWAAAVAVPSARRSVLAGLRMTRGERGRLRDTIDVARTFGGYASHLAEALAAGSKNAREPDVAVDGVRHLDDAMAIGRGVILATLHTGGWDIVGPSFAKMRGVDVVMVMAPERDERARAIQDRARRERGLRVVHVGDDPLATLDLLASLREGHAVAVQIDRVPPKARARAVTLFDAPGQIPEGPLRLAAASGAPIVPMFFSRRGFRAYAIDVRPALRLAPRPSEVDLDRAAETLASEMSTFLRAHPTEWFHFDAPPEAT